MPTYPFHRLLVPAVAIASLLCLALIVAGCDAPSGATTSMTAALQTRCLVI